MVKTKVALPTHEQCFKIWDQYHTPRHVQEHLKQVNRVAMHLAQQLKTAGKDVKLDLVDRASLLHDTVRVTEQETLDFEQFPYPPSQEDVAAWKAQRKQFPPNIHHAQVNYEVFKDKYPEMAPVILRHSISAALDVKTWEEKVVNYADKRVTEDNIVTLRERFEAWQKYYQEAGQAIDDFDPALEQAIYAIEQEIFSVIGGNPDELNL